MERWTKQEIFKDYLKYEKECEKLDQELINAVRKNTKDYLIKFDKEVKKQKQQAVKKSYVLLFKFITLTIGLSLVVIFIFSKTWKKS